MTFRAIHRPSWSSQGSQRLPIEAEDSYSARSEIPSNGEESQQCGISAMFFHQHHLFEDADRWGKISWKDRDVRLKPISPKGSWYRRRGTGANRNLNRLSLGCHIGHSEMVDVCLERGQCAPKVPDRLCHVRDTWSVQDRLPRFTEILQAFHIAVGLGLSESGRWKKARSTARSSMIAARIKWMWLSLRLMKEKTPCNQN